MKKSFLSLFVFGFFLTHLGGIGCGGGSEDKNSAYVDALSSVEVVEALFNEVETRLEDTLDAQTIAKIHQEPYLISDDGLVQDPLPFIRPVLGSTEGLVAQGLTQQTTFPQLMDWTKAQVSAIKNGLNEGTAASVAVAMTAAGVARDTLLSAARTVQESTATGSVIVSFTLEELGQQLGLVECLVRAGANPKALTRAVCTMLTAYATIAHGNHRAFVGRGVQLAGPSGSISGLLKPIATQAQTLHDIAVTYDSDNGTAIASKVQAYTQKIGVMIGVFDQQEADASELAAILESEAKSFMGVVATTSEFLVSAYGKLAAQDAKEDQKILQAMLEALQAAKASKIKDMMDKIEECKNEATAEDCAQKQVNQALDPQMGGMSAVQEAFQSLSNTVFAVVDPNGVGMDLYQQTQQMQESQMSVNLQTLNLQNTMQHQSKSYTLIVNVMKKKHKTTQDSIDNIKE